LFDQLTWLIVEAIDGMR